MALERTLLDRVGPGMRLLCCGLNPSVRAARAGVGYVTPGNRFWPALLAAGLATVDRDPDHALVHHGIGFTDLVKRATPSADELTADELRAGWLRVAALAEHWRPGALCVLGLTGWRTATGDRRATVGWQPATDCAVPVYLMPNPSGLNAHVTVDDIATHLLAAVAGPR